MIDDKILDLMNREIDKANTDKDSAELNKLLDEISEAKQHYNELLKMTSSLKNIPNVEPPSDMKMNIMNSIDTNKYAQIADKPGFFQSLAEFFQIRPNLRLATTFAVGAAFGLVLFAVSDKYGGAEFPLNQSHLSGTIMIDKALDEYTTIESKAIESEYISGTFEIKKNNNDLLADIVINSDVPAVIKLGFDNNHTVFKGFNQMEYTYSGVNISDTEISWEHFGNNRFIINLENVSSLGSVVRLNIYSDQINIEESIPTLIQ